MAKKELEGLMAFQLWRSRSGLRETVKLNQIFLIGVSESTTVVVSN